MIRFASGHRLKIKGSAYRRLHAMISRVTPLGVHDAMAAGDDLDLVRREIPEEYWSDFDRIRELLMAALRSKIDGAEALVRTLTNFSDKDIGLMIGRGDLPEELRPFVFSCRRRPKDWSTDPRTRWSLLRSIRPVGNQLEGYTPSTYVLGLGVDN